ncbi:hypothetical protein GCM10027444_15830 [Actinopolyspora lacussalsi]
MARAGAPEGPIPAGSATPATALTAGVPRPEGVPPHDRDGSTKREVRTVASGNSDRANRVTPDSPRRRTTCGTGEAAGEVVAGAVPGSLPGFWCCCSRSSC